MTESLNPSSAPNVPTLSTHSGAGLLAERYPMAVPQSWPHYEGPLHALLAFQAGKCAVCFVAVKWSDEKAGKDGVASNSMRQWVEDDLILGLVCYRCARRYKTLQKKPDGAAVAGLPAFLADPPGQRCAATVGLGPQSRPRRFNSGLMPTEVPAPETWSYTGTVTHTLFLWQRGRCAICSTGLSVASRPRYVHVDHDDSTGLIRGLLCHRCNTCLGQDWPATWWEHHAPTVAAYLEFPPAQVCPATRGLSMVDRNRAAVLTQSADRNEILLDGMPMGIAAPPVPAAPRAHWYAIRYAPTAPIGLPPVLQASIMLPFSDATGRGLGFFMDPPAHATRQQPICILRVSSTDVLDVTEHASLTEAHAVAFAPAKPGTTESSGL